MSGMASSPGVRRAETLDRILAPGILAGMVAALLMGLLAVIAAVAWRHLPASTPLTEIAVLADPRLAGAVTDQPVAKEPLVFAGAVHLLVGGLLGGAFAVIARVARLAGLARGGGAQAAAVPLAGVLYGLVVMALMSLVVLPAVGSLSGAGAPISDLASRVGWATFAAEHALFGLALGLWVLVRPWDVTRAPGRAGDPEGVTE
jgi:hypothetical protein